MNTSLPLTLKRNVITTALLLEVVVIVLYAITGFVISPRFADKILFFAGALVFLLFTMQKPFYTICFIACTLPFTRIRISGLSLLDAAILVLFFTTFATIVLRREKLPYSSFLTRPMLLLLLSVVVAFVAAVNKGWFSGKLLRDTMWFAGFIILIFIGIMTLKTKKQLVILTYCLLGIATLVALIAIYQRHQLILSSTMYMKTTRISGSMFGHANQIAGFINLFLPLGLSMFLFSKSICLRSTLAGILSIMLVALVFTFSRGAWLALFLMSLYIIIQSRSFKKIIPVLIMMVVIITVSGLYEVAFYRIKSTSGYDPAVVGRMVLWRGALNTIKDNFLTGVGMDNFSVVKYLYGVPLRFDPLKGMSAHNVFLEVFADFGILGIIAFIWLFSSLLINLNRAIRFTEDPTMKAIAIGLSAAMIGYLIHGLVDCSIANQSATFGLGLLMAMSVISVRAVKFIKIRTL